MSKLSCALFVFALVYCVGVYADDSGFEVPSIRMPDPPTAEDIANLQKPANGNVQGHFTEHHSSVQIVNGKVVKDEAGGKEIQNDNGQVTGTSYSN